MPFPPSGGTYLGHAFLWRLSPSCRKPVKSTHHFQSWWLYNRAGSNKNNLLRTTFYPELFLKLQCWEICVGNTCTSASSDQPTVFKEKWKINSLKMCQCIDKCCQCFFIHSGAHISHYSACSWGSPWEASSESVSLGLYGPSEGKVWTHRI